MSDLEVLNSSQACGLEGLQVGVVNYADEAEGLQIGVINVMRDGKWPALPIVNFGF